MFGRGIRNNTTGVNHQIWLDSYDPRHDQYYNENINSYRTGPGSYMPREQQPYYRRQHQLPYKLYVRDIHINTSEEGLYNAFSRFGEPLFIKKINRYRDPCAFVEFATQREADSAIAGLHQQPPLNWCVTYAQNRHDSHDSFMEEARNFLDVFDEIDEALTLCEGSGLDERVQPLTRENIEIFNRSEYPPCVLCGVPACFNCNNCKTRYCSRRCQSTDWPYHRTICVPPPPLVPDYSTLPVGCPITRQPIPSVMDSTGSLLQEVAIPHREGLMNATKFSSSRDNQIIHLRKNNSNAENTAMRESKPSLVECQHPASFTRQPSSQLHRHPNQPVPTRTDAAPTNPPHVDLNPKYCPSKSPYCENENVKSCVVKPDERSSSRTEPCAGQNRELSTSQFQKGENKSSPIKDHQGAIKPNQTNFENRRVPAEYKNETRQSEDRAWNNSQPRTNKFDESVRKPLISIRKTTTRLPSTVQPSPKFAVAYRREELKLPSQSNLPVTVCFARSPDDFYIHLNSIVAPLNDLVRKMQESIGRCPRVDNPVEGLPCSALFDGLWYRAVILCDMQPHVGLRFVDYGNTIKCLNTIEHVRLLDDEFSYNPFYAIKVKLADILPAHESNWDEKAKNAFKDLTENQSFRLEVVDMADLQPAVRLKKMDDNIDIGKHLVQLGFAANTSSKADVASSKPTSPKKNVAKPVTPIKTVSANCTKQGTTPVVSPDILPTKQSTPVNHFVTSPGKKENSAASRNNSRNSPKKKFETSSPVKNSASRSSVESNAKQSTISSPVANDITPSVTSNKHLPSVIDDLKVEEVAVFMVGVPLDPETKSCAGSILSSSEAATIAQFHSLIESSASDDNFSPLVGSLVGSLVAAYSVELEQWFRACILTSCNQKYTVLYIDYGNIENGIVLVKSIPEVYNYPTLGIRLVIPDTLTPEAKSYCFERMDVNSLHKLEVLERLSNGTLKCLLKDNENISTVCEVLIENWTFMIPVPANVTPVLGNTQTEQVIKEAVFNVGYNTDVHIMDIKDLDNIYIQLLAAKTADALNIIQNDLNVICPKLPPLKEYPMPGTFVAAVFPEDGNFYRAKIETITNNMITVFYVDFGNSSDVTLEQIRILPSHLYAYESCSHCVGLASVEPTEELSAELTSFLLECVGQQFFMFVKEINPHKVLLSKDGTVINDKINQMVKNDSAVKGIQSSVKDVIEEMPQLVPNNPTVENIPVENPTVDNKPGNFKYEDGPFLDMPNDGQPFKAIILDADNPQVLQICPDDPNILSKLRDLQEEIAKYANASSYGHSPVVGEICLVRSPDDGVWYRAACVSIIENEMLPSFAVIFVDYGRVSCVGVDDIRRIPKRFVDWLPYVSQQAILQGFDNYSELEEELSQKVVSFIPTNEPVTLRIVGRIEEVIIVDIPSVRTRLEQEGIL